MVGAQLEGFVFWKLSPRKGRNQLPSRALSTALPVNGFEPKVGIRALASLSVGVLISSEMKSFCTGSLGSLKNLAFGVPFVERERVLMEDPEALPRLGPAQG